MHPAHPVRHLLFRLFGCPRPQAPATMASYGTGLEVVGQRHQIVFAAFCGYESPRQHQVALTLLHEMAVERLHALLLLTGQHR